MTIAKDTSVAVVVSRTWANMHGVKMFLRQGRAAQAEIRGVDDSHILFAKVVDLDDARGVWLHLTSQAGEDGGPAEAFQLLVPWNQIFAIALAAQFSQALRQEARRIGFTGETEQE